MQKRTLHHTLITFMFILAGHLAAQAQRNVQFGLKGGLNYTNLYIDEAAEEDAQLGFHIGAAAEIPFSKFTSIQPEVHYSTKGVSSEYNLADFGGSADFNINYVDIPVLLKINLLGNIFDVHAGPYAGYLVNANITSEGDLGSVGINLDEDDFNRWDYGLAAGFGVHLSSAEIGIRYNYGLRPIANSDATDLLLGNSKNVNLQVYLTVGL